ncbi:hypothetical protein VMCG_01921 [Cytospora schulzeri]|uniref:RRM domain-containing protein n=1 Tax=Cytospora schulzeri TaxID=448051 RepID=A0A423X2Z9_9PEZI|nr:hypothetical protein VMCG_01921 [Valsa malicola]
MEAPRAQQEEPNTLPLPQTQTIGLSTPQSSITDNDHEPNDPFRHNAALWLTNLPPNCTIRQLIRAIISVGPTGRILFCKIAPPYLSKHNWAAKVVFATRLEARRLLAVSRSRLFFVRGHRIHVDWHRVLSTSFHAIEPITRVLIIEGPSYIVDRSALRAYFRRKLRTLDTEEVIELERPEGDRQRATIIWRFGSWFGQAQTAAAALGEDYPDLVDVHYGLDPCASLRPEDFTP